MKKNVLLLVAAALVVLGALAIVLQPGPPESECVPDGSPSSGFVDEEKDCAISDESWAEISDHNSSPKPFRIVGALLVLAGLVTAVVALVVGRRRSAEPGQPSP